MKPLFIQVNLKDHSVLFVNSQDLKMVDVRPNPGTDTGSKVDVTTSTGTWEADMTKYAVDKLRKELRDRYNVVHIDRNGVRTETNAHKNSIFFVKEDDALTIVWPKSLQKMLFSDGVITITWTDTSVDIPTDRPVEELTKELQSAHEMLVVTNEES